MLLDRSSTSLADRDYDHAIFRRVDYRINVRPELVPVRARRVTEKDALLDTAADILTDFGDGS